MSRLKVSNGKDWSRHKQPSCSRVRWCLGLAVGSLALTTLSFSLLSIPTSSALDASSVDNITIIVPASCSLSGTNTEHAATINNGTYNSNIGLTTMKAFCNDNEGFSIYAIGYTNEQDGNTVLTNGTAADNIVTGTATSGNTSNWAMKLATPTNPAPTYPLTLGSDTNGSFGDYHIVPNTFTKVAYRTASTDVGQNAEGSTLTSTYQAYISPTQPAGTYTGKVKYLLVHPANISSVSTEALTLDFVVPAGSNMSFSGGATTNTVKYRKVCVDPQDTTTCRFIATEGEYQHPTNYKGAWSANVPGMGAITLGIQNQEFWEGYLANNNGEMFLGYKLTVTAYNGEAILYDGNGATSGDMSMVATNFIDTTNGAGTAMSSDSLLAPNFKKPGYGFAGWSTSSNATPGGASTIYGPNETVNKTDFTFDQNGVATLYAVWVPSAGTMQNFSCNNLASGAVTALTDTRDGNVYTVAKLADGNCWMMENLRLGSIANLDSTNTNNPVITNLPASSDDWCETANAACINQSELNTNNTNIGGVNSAGEILRPYFGEVRLEFEREAYWYGYGNYYNWYAATAGNGTYNTTGNAAGDICPSGWSLPTGGSSGQFSALDRVMGGTGSSQESEEASNRWRAYPKNFVIAGAWVDASVMWTRESDQGGYWSKSGGSRYYAACAFGLDPEGIYLITSAEKSFGVSVRCLALGGGGDP